MKNQLNQWQYPNWGAAIIALEVEKEIAKSEFGNGPGVYKWGECSYAIYDENEKELVDGSRQFDYPRKKDIQGLIEDAVNDFKLTNFSIFIEQRMDWWEDWNTYFKDRNQYEPSEYATVTVYKSNPNQNN